MKKEIFHDTRRLLVPFWFTALVILLGAWMLQSVDNDKIVSVHDAFEILYYANGGSMNYHKLFGNFASSGSVWFLPALFWAKSCFNGLSNCTEKRHWLWLSTVLCVAAVVVGQYMVLPYCMIQGFTAVVFVCIGATARRYGIGRLYNTKRKKLTWMVLILCWLAATPFNVMDIYQIQWNLGILPNIAIGTTGTLACYELSRFIVSRLPAIKLFFMTMGKYSLVILCFAPIKYFLMPIEVLAPFNGMAHRLIVIGVKVGWIVATIMLARYCRPLRWVFKLR